MDAFRTKREQDRIANPKRFARIEKLRDAMYKRSFDALQKQQGHKQAARRARVILETLTVLRGQPEGPIKQALGKRLSRLVAEYRSHTVEANAGQRSNRT
jgi:hypothetical protein